MAKIKLAISFDYSFFSAKYNVLNILIGILIITGQVALLLTLYNNAANIGIIIVTLKTVSIFKTLQETRV